MIEIRDAALALRPWHDPQVAPTAAEAARAAGLDGDDLAASVEAAVLAAALRAKVGGQPARQAADVTWQPHVPGPDLRSEAAWLAKVSRAFSRLTLAERSTRDEQSGVTHDGDARLGEGPAMSIRLAAGSRLDGHQAPIEGWRLRRSFGRRIRL